ncbi:Rho GTPase activation protein [Rickenella mellea]|uniref:Rho GTPase activation protein n=1 Tax=Rickenella mellea TaxID=50990 RepID=A0A4Y7QM15_9AGAM|nr:Rho GTPase activation protein [Rickenella mellea]
MAPAPSLDIHNSDPWDSVHMPGSRDFLVSVELWSPPSRGLARKVNIPRKTAERRDSMAIPDNRKIIKEKPSWFRTLGQPPGDWRHATCKLTEEGDRCVLNIYVDENILQHSIYIHLLRCSDIRPADRSLFFPNTHSLGIYTTAGQRWLENETDEVVYIKFSSSDAVNTWLALLRSYACPEAYGQRLAPQNGGLYRMWRQVELRIIQGRHLGVTRAVTHQILGLSSDGDGGDAVEMEVFCQIHFNDNTCGRTAPKKSMGSQEWHEQFVFSDLPPFGEMVIQVYKTKSAKALLLGSIFITLGTFRRGELVDGWFPVISAGSTACAVQVGEIRLKVKVDEEIILPNSAYAAVMQSILQRNMLDLLSDLEQEMKLEHISSHVIAIAIAKNVLTSHITELADREVDGAPNSQHTLFRGNTVLTKTMELTMSSYGKAFLEASVGPVIRSLCKNKVAIEVDPLKSNKSIKDIEKNVEVLEYWCREFWKQIYSVRAECPHELRKIFQHIRQLVEERFDSPESRDLKWQSVSAFCFLRFIVPAILHPHLFGLCHGLPPEPVQRSLILIAKVMQSLANLNPTVQKEEFMRGIKNFLKDSIPAMIDYILVVSTPVPERYGVFPPATNDNHDRIQAMNSLRERAHSMPTLHREAIPLLPHLIDVSKHLAILGSAIVRNISRRNGELQKGSPLEELSQKCLEVEAEALQCVNQLATRLHYVSVQSQVGSRNAFHDGSSPSSPINARFLHSQSNIPSSYKARRYSKSGRPSTAPSSSETYSDIPSSSSAEKRTLVTVPAVVRAVRVQAPSSALPQEPVGELASSWREPAVLVPSTADLHEEPSEHRKQSFLVRPSPSLPSLEATADSEESRKRKGFLHGLWTRR